MRTGQQSESRKVLQPPSGEPPPLAVTMDDGQSFDLLPLAEQICATYRGEFPDEKERYGDAGHAWCVHDNLHLLEWGFQSTEGTVDMEAEVAWLARVLESRDFPLVRLARDLEIGAEVLMAGPASRTRRAVSIVWAKAALMVRSRRTFLDPP